MDLGKVLEDPDIPEEIRSTWITYHEGSIQAIYSTDIHLQYGQLDNVLSWCRQYLTDIWRWRMEEFPSETQKGRYTFFFKDEKEFELFTLRWK